VEEPTLFADAESPSEPAPAAVPNKSAPGLSEQQQTVLQGMDAEPMSVDAIVERTTLPAHVVMQELTFLSLKGAVKRVDGQMYAKR
jgi:predicted Rossmann fold nucleotide-binding protein DprA/Smf involved in DNA uptake